MVGAGDLQKIRMQVFTLDSEDDLLPVGKYLLGADVKMGHNIADHAKFEFADKDNYIYNSIRTDSTFPIVFSASLDDGANWYRIFRGTVEVVRTGMDTEGKRRIWLDAYAARTLRESYISPNHIGIGDCNLGALFTGTPSVTFRHYDSTWSANWNTDSNGNYPNGFLYDTGYSLSADSITDYFPGINDVSIKFGYGSTDRLDAMLSTLEPFGVTLRINDIDGDVCLISNSALGLWIPAGAQNTMSVGGNVNTLEKTFYLGEKVDSVFFIGGNSALFFVTGTGVRQSLYMDDEVKDIDTARSMSGLFLDINSVVPKDVTVVGPPNFNLWQHSRLRSSYKIVDGNETVSANIIGISHKISSDRWTTQYDFQKPHLKEAEIFSEVKEKLKNYEENMIKNWAYVNVRADTSSTFAAQAPYESNYPVAMAISTLSNDDGGDVISGTLEIVPLTYTTSNTGATDYPTMSAFAKFENCDRVGMVKCISLMGNFLPKWQHADYYSRSTLFNLNDTVQMLNANDCSATYTLSSFFDSGRWPISIEKISLQSIVATCSAYQYVASDADVRFMDWSVKGTVHPATSETWSYGTQPSPEDMSFMSFMGCKPNIRYKVASFTTDMESDNQHGILKFKWKSPVSPASYSSQLVYYLTLRAAARGIYYRSGTGPYYMTVSGYVWNHNSQVWVSVSEYYRGVDYKMDYETWTSPNTHLYFDDDGYVHYMLSSTLPDIGSGEDCMNEIIVDYITMLMDVNTHYYEDLYDVNDGTDDIVEKCKYDRETLDIITTFEPSVVKGAYLEYVELPNGHISASGPNVVSDLTGSGNYAPQARSDRKSSWDMLKSSAFYTWKLLHASPQYREAERRIFNIKPKQSNLELIYDNVTLRTAFEQGWIVMSYSTQRGVSLDAPPEYDVSKVVNRISYTDDGYGCGLVLNLDSAPPFGNEILVNYKAVGSDDEDESLVLSIYNLSSSTTSAIREGIAKDWTKKLAVQFDVSSEEQEQSVYGDTYNMTLDLDYDHIDSEIGSYLYRPSKW